jgi:hypothetical protein
MAARSNEFGFANYEIEQALSRRTNERTRL